MMQLIERAMALIGGVFCLTVAILTMPFWLPLACIIACIMAFIRSLEKTVDEMLSKQKSRQNACQKIRKPPPQET